MSAQQVRTTDPLLAGFFSISEAARLVGVGQPLVRGWLNGYPGSGAGPVVKRDFGGTRTVSFLDLMELRFIAIFRAQKVPMPTLRKAAEQARRPSARAFRREVCHGSPQDICACRAGER